MAAHLAGMRAAAEIEQARARTLQALILACLIPVLVLMLPAHPMTTAAAVVIHLIGAFAARWLFFAQAEHVVGLYYGKR